MNDDLEWQPLTTAVEIVSLLTIFGGFHDSCITEVLVRNREYVTEELEISFDHSPMVQLTFQRQAHNPTTIKVQFEDVQSLNWVHQNLNADTEFSVLFEAAMFFRDDMLFWAEDSDWFIEELETKDLRWLSARSGRWRVIN